MTEIVETWITYVNPDRFHVVESLISKYATKMAAPIMHQSDVREDLVAKIWGNGTDSCIRNITHSFPDGPTKFCILDLNLPNAAIFKHGAEHFIVITVGLINAITGVSLRMMNSDSLEKYIMEGVDPEEPDYHGVLSRDDALRRLALVELRDSSVAGQATLLFFLSSYFICAHELGHLALGHLNCQNENAAMTEFDPPSKPEQNSRILEWDADAFAAAATLWHMGHLAKEPVLKEYFGVIPRAHRYFTVLIYLIFTVFDAWAPEGRAIEGRTHPEALVRVGILTPLLQHILNNWSGKGTYDILEVSRKSIRAFEISLFELCGGNMSRDEAIRLQKAAEDMLEEIISGWDGIRESLDRSRLNDLFFAKSLI